MFNTAAAMNWDVSFVGHPSMASANSPAWSRNRQLEKVYAIGYKTCSYDAPASCRPRAGSGRCLVKANVVLNDTLLWWVAGASMRSS